MKPPIPYHDQVSDVLYSIAVIVAVLLLVIAAVKYDWITTAIDALLAVFGG